jgi:multiple sugar transport system ATP-binding protein
MNLIAGKLAEVQGAATIGIRPEHVVVNRDGPGSNNGGWTGRVAVAEHLGSDTFLYVDVPEVGTLTARCPGEMHVQVGETIGLAPDPTRLHRFDKDGKAIHS